MRVAHHGKSEFLSFFVFTKRDSYLFERHFLISVAVVL